MKTKFILKPKELNKKWLKAIQALYGKATVVVTVETEDEAMLSDLFSEDEWEEWDENQWEDLLSIENEEMEEEESISKEEPVEEKPKSKRGRKPANSVEATPSVEEKPKTKRGPRKKNPVENAVAEETPQPPKTRRNAAKTEKAE
jgi:hypothetical protein